MKKAIGISFFIGFLIFMTGCKKDSGNSPTPTDTPSVIVITSPNAGTIVLNGSVLKVEGEITDNNNLSTANVVIKNKASGAILFQQQSTTGTVSFYRFLWNWTVSGITVSTNAVIRVTAKDKLGNEVYKEIEVTLIP